jgi:hypothetical protein
MDTNPRATLRILDGRHELALLGLTRDEVSFWAQITVGAPARLLGATEAI